MPMFKKPEGLEDYEVLRVKNSNGDTIVDVLSLATGLDMAINAIKPGEITKKARKALTDVTAQSYGLFSYKIALRVLQDEDLAKKEATISDFSFRFDTPDEEHDDLIIYYKSN